MSSVGLPSTRYLHACMSPVGVNQDNQGDVAHDRQGEAGITGFVQSEKDKVMGILLFSTT